jgi:mRNA interferase MazF
MVSRGYVPEAGDLIWLNFNPQAGHEQAGHRPALVLSPAIYNEKKGLAVVVPITSKIKPDPFQIQLPAGMKVSGAILTDHLKSVDWRARKASFRDRLPQFVLRNVRHRIALLLEIA